MLWHFNHELDNRVWQVIYQQYFSSAFTPTSLQWRNISGWVHSWKPIICCIYWPSWVINGAYYCNTLLHIANKFYSFLSQTLKLRFEARTWKKNTGHFACPNWGGGGGGVGCLLDHGHLLRIFMVYGKKLMWPIVRNDWNLIIQIQHTCWLSFSDMVKNAMSPPPPGPSPPNLMYCHT